MRNWYLVDRMPFLFRKMMVSICKDAEIEVGDTLILFNLKGFGPHTVNACIFKSEHIVVYDDLGKTI